MGRSIYVVLLAAVMHLIFISSSYSSDHVTGEDSLIKSSKNTVQSRDTYQNRDIAFLSIGGSHPDSKKLHGFQSAVLFNARGEVVKRINMRNDSIYSLDKMFEVNKSHGPLYVKMYR